MPDSVQAFGLSTVCNPGEKLQKERKESVESENRDTGSVKFQEQLLPNPVEKRN